MAREALADPRAELLGSLHVNADATVLCVHRHDRSRVSSRSELELHAPAPAITGPRDAPHELGQELLDRHACARGYLSLRDVRGGGRGCRRIEARVRRGELREPACRGVERVDVLLVVTFVVAMRVNRVPSLTSVTLTPATTAPAWSVTVPTMEPDCAWAKAEGASEAVVRHNTNQKRANPEALKTVEVHI